MLKQTFVVTLEISSPFERFFPKVEAERMASIIRDGVEAKSVSFMGAVPFSISVERMEGAASASGQMREYSSQDFVEAGEVLQELAKIPKTVPGECPDYK